MLDLISSLIESWRIWLPLLKAGAVSLLAYKSITLLPSIFSAIKSGLSGIGALFSAAANGQKDLTTGALAGPVAMTKLGDSAKAAGIGLRLFASINIITLLARYSRCYLGIIRSYKKEL